jgi:hypothetical protein
MRQKLQISNLLILEIVFHVTWNSASIDAEQLRDYSRPYTELGFCYRSVSAIDFDELSLFSK